MTVKRADEGSETSGNETTAIVSDVAPRVDIIILSWNRTDDTIEAIRSALAQEKVDQTVIVVDQGSDAENIKRLRALAAEDRRVVLKEMGRNLGVPGGRNEAAFAGSAPTIISLDNDAEFETPTTAYEAAQALESDNSLAAVGFRIMNYFTGDDDMSSWGYSSHLKKRIDQPFYASAFVGAGHAIRRSAFEKVGGYYDKLFFCCEEIELGLKFHSAGYQIKYQPQLRVRHKVSPEARVTWGKGRYYFTLRNRLFIHLKTGSKPRRIIEFLAGHFIRATRNGLIGDWVRGVFDGYKMRLQYKIDPALKPFDSMPSDVMAYINKIQGRQDNTFTKRLRNVFAEDLPRINK